MTPAKKLAIVVALQFLVMLSVLGFKQYTVRTSETVLLKLQPVDARDLLRDDAPVEYEISLIEPASIAWDESAARCCEAEVYVELQQQGDGYWHAIAAHNQRTHTRDGTLLIKGKAQGDFYEYPPQTVTIRYGIEDIFVPEGSASQLPTSGDHAIGVELKVDRFGNATPRHFVIDGQPVKLKRR
ncbi:MAG: GDYXXLXY domain-containing protein [Chloroflexi bacterium]|nr:GDYXXLXY domain-containing protein [Chloroflexota bacterium]